ncbi:dihydroorotate dehydrogenase electron transfer subunit [Chengkuizengella axinellae]|uniref:Dihydroorotate dehydrogenase B (NAD(+)), electron transfer subunit n=1 Tax=Chengkuizengella axinellae TaxID=3064388 RepID=A0ABT9J851_9BACL|nr:dihydroorotate dehydrogenase electron transfer subunit [Chengkuizengella sp. 2205SS18-9]MDP5277109.1 dihydroorotate dehydrogenase electron transfer subunit [Chengkuizengella sp. 2205SS18-9]
MSQNDKKKRMTAKILDNRQIATNIYEMVLHNDEITRATMPGQFINLYCRNESKLLPRPISVCETDHNEGTMKLVYAVVGAGTKEFIELQSGETIDILGPLGNGYDVNQPVKEHIIIGGGLGIPPLLELTKRLRGKKKIVLGFRDKLFLVNEFKRYADELYISTTDGSVGEQGNVIDLLNRNDITGDMFYSCGSKRMLKAVHQWSIHHQIEGQISLEERMGCSFGACVGCVAKIKRQGKQWEYKKVCTEGPIFFNKEVVFDV